MGGMGYMNNAGHLRHRGRRELSHSNQEGAHTMAKDRTAAKRSLNPTPERLPADQDDARLGERRNSRSTCRWILLGGLRHRRRFARLATTAVSMRRFRMVRELCVERFTQAGSLQLIWAQTP